MGLSVTVEVETGLPEALRELIASLEGDLKKDLHEVGARAASEAAAQYHTKFEEGRKWINPSLPTHGFGQLGERKKTDFGVTVATAWRVGAITDDGADIVNAAPAFAHKVRGGTITAKRKRFLTIPMVPEAHGRRASEFASDFNKKLFPVGLQGFGGQGVLAYALDNGTIRAVYALKKSVTQKPWEGALPPTELLADAFAEPIVDAIERNLE